MPRQADDAALADARQEGRDVGLDAKVRAYDLQDRGLGTHDAHIALGQPARARTYAIAARIRRNLGMTTIRLVTNSPDKVRAAGKLGIRVVETPPLAVGVQPLSRCCLRARRERCGHRLPAWIGWQRRHRRRPGAGGRTGLRARQGGMR